MNTRCNITIPIIHVGGSLKGIRLSGCKWVQGGEYFETFLKSCSSSLLELYMHGCQSLLPFPQQLEKNSNSNSNSNSNTHSESTNNPPIESTNSTHNIDNNNTENSHCNSNSNSTSNSNSNSNGNSITHSLEYLPPSLLSISLCTPCLNVGLVRYLAKRCPLLQRVDIGGCHDLSNEALLALR